MMSTKQINELIDKVMESLKEIIELKWPDDEMFLEYDLYHYDIRNGKRLVGDWGYEDSIVETDDALDDELQSVDLDDGYSLADYSTRCISFAELAERYEMFIGPGNIGEPLLRQDDKTLSEVKEIFKKLTDGLWKLGEVCNDYAEEYLDIGDLYRPEKEEEVRIGEICERYRNSDYHLLNPKGVLKRVIEFRDEVNS